ncbi:MFS transporter [uncultured Paraglaciecola sp.]|uniref:MFS transporter n=1 Tax=uncultured Paraglaciecola sp. TaxID=1765024 RepID=UPI0030DAC089|tara:strand:- start:42021 stop:43220 length:1200 start_codon:yes stop_codon:yes gene_type:complete
MARFSFLRPHLGLIIAGSAAFSMSTLFSSVKPVLLTQFMKEVGAQASLAGWIVATPFIGIALATLFVAKLLERYSYRLIITYAGAALVTCQALNSLFFVNSFSTLLLQLVSGISVGVLMGATSSFIARSNATGALFGLVDMIGVLLMSLMVAGASMTTEKYGVAGGFVFSALLCILFWLAMYVYKQETVTNISHQSAGETEPKEFKLSLRPVIIIIMGVLFVTFSGQGFAFMFTVASNLGMTFEQSGNSIGLILFLSAFACLIGGMCSARFGPEKPLLVAFIVCALGWTTAINSQSQSLFLMGLFPAICALQFSFPVLLSLAGTLDNHGRWAAIATPLFTSGFAWAAIMSGQVVEIWGLSTLATTTQIGMLICIVLLGVSIWISTKQSAKANIPIDECA